MQGNDITLAKNCKLQKTTHPVLDMLEPFMKKQQEYFNLILQPWIVSDIHCWGCFW